MEIKKKILLSVIVAIILIGTIGFKIFEDLEWIDALYFTISTITSVGYGDITVKTRVGQLFAIFMIITGVGVFFSGVSYIVLSIIESRIASLVGVIEARKLKNHVIICGYNPIADQVTEELKNYKIPFVIVENKEDAVKKLRVKKIPYFEADPADEVTLKTVNIDLARSLIATTDDDATNAYAVITARSLKPDLRIVASADDEDIVRKLYSAGADRVIMPKTIGSKLISRSAITPYVADFMDKITLFRDVELVEYPIEERSKLIGLTLEKSRIREIGPSVVGIWKRGNFLPNPDPGTILELNDVLILIGTDKQFKEFRKMLK